MRPISLGTASALTLALTGCGSSTGSVDVDVEWWINSTVPTRESCREQGIDRVRLSVGPRDRDREGGGEYEFDCEDGYGIARVEVDDAGLGIAGGTYDYALEALDAQGKALQHGEGSFDSPGSGGLVELPVLDFFQPYGESGWLTAGWEFAGEPDLARACRDWGVATVALDLASASDEDFVDALELGQAACEDGEIAGDDSFGLAAGEYWVQYVALDGQGEAVAWGEAVSVSVFGPDEQIDLPTETFR